MRKTFLLFVLGASFVGTTAMGLQTTFAQETVTRMLPANVQYAKTGKTQDPPYVALKKGFFHRTQLLRFAVGGAIFDTNNRTIPLSALPEHVQVAYTLNIQGEIQRIYILTTNEIAAEAAATQ